MKLNCSRMEALVSGEPCRKSSTLDVAVLAEGSFTGRVKRAGGRTTPLGCVNLLLVENKATASENLAICHTDEKISPERGMSLMFPLLTGQEFGNVNRHGNVLTVHSTKVVLILESLGDLDVESDHNIATSAGKWSRILSRLVFAEQGHESRNLVNQSRSGARSQGFGIDGLGISVQPQEPLPLVNHYERVAPSAFNSSRSRPRQLVPTSLHSMSARNLQDAPNSAPACLEQGPSLPQSQSFKRISLVLGSSDTDFGFGDDLKKILQTIDEPVNTQPQLPGNQVDDHNPKSNSPERTYKPSALTFLPPPAPFSDDLESDLSVTPSPNSIYLNPDAEISGVSFDSPANSSRRIDSILAKEQQQYAEKYGSRASTLTRPSTSFLTTSVSEGDTSSIRSNSRVPPPMPAPVFNNKIGDYTLSVDDLRMTTSSENSKTEPNGEAPDESEVANSAVESVNGTIKKAKNVQIASEVSVINGSDGQPAIDSASVVSVDMSQQPSASRSVSGQSQTKLTIPTELPNKETKSSGPKFSKVMRKLLGRRKSKINSADTSYTEISGEKSLGLDLGNDSQQTLNSPDESSNSPFFPGVDSSSSREFADSPVSEVPNPRSSGGRKHLYVSLLEQQTSPSSADVPTSASGISLMECCDKNNSIDRSPTNDEGQSNRTKHHEAKDDNAKDYSRAAEYPAEVIATSNNNGCKTAAVPKLTNSTSALSFRSLSSRSLSTRSLTSSNSLDHLASFIHLGPEDQPADSSSTKTLSDSPKHKPRIESIEEKPVPADENTPKLAAASTTPEATPKVATSTRHEEVSPPTLLRRESRQQLESVPVSLDLDAYMRPPVSATRKMYESDNKSTSALPVKSASYSSFGSSRRSFTSHSSGSSVSSIGSSRKGIVTLFAAHMWGSIWNNNRWVPLSQLELPTEVIVTDAGSTARILVSGGASVNIDFGDDCEIRKVSHHDVEVRATESTYMFRSRDADIAQRLYRLLWSIQCNGVQPVLSSLSMTNSLTSVNAEILDENDVWACRRRTLMPPVLSKSNPNLNLSYMGRLTSTIIEE